MAPLGRATRGAIVGRGAVRGRIVHVALERALHGHGHRVDHGVGRRGAGDDAAGERGDPCARRAAARDGRDGRAARGRDGSSRRAQTLADSHGPGLRQRDPGRHGHRWIDQRDHPSRRDRRPRWRRAAAQRFDDLSKTTPFLVNLRPSGKYLMEDFFYAGGLPVVLKELLSLLHGGALTVNGRAIADNVREATCFDQDVIRPLQMPLAREGGTVILFGNLCPDGAVLKQSAASPHLLTHRGRAVVFEDHADLHRRIDDERLPIDENSVLVLKQVGPRGAPGMPEWGAAPIPARLLRRGVKDMMRISDARMSGTSYGTVVLHVAPESAVGGPLALVRDGDEIELDVPGRRLTLRVGDGELARRRAAWKPRPAHFSRGYGKLFLDHVLQANEGCDFDYLRGRSPVRHEDTAGPSHS